MKLHLIVVPLLAIAAITSINTVADELDTVPKKSIAKKKELLFSDDFNGDNNLSLFWSIYLSTCNTKTKTTTRTRTTTHTK